MTSASIIKPWLYLAFALIAAPALAQQSPAAAALDLTIKDYCAAWSEPDALKRQKLLDTVWALKGTYTDPTAAVTGRAKLVAHIGAVLKTSVPLGTRVVATSHADLHHGVFRFAWQAVLPDNSVIIEGVDFGETDKKGRIKRITGFFDPVQPLPKPE